MPPSRGRASRGGRGGRGGRGRGGAASGAQTGQPAEAQDTPAESDVATEAPAPSTSQSTTIMTGSSDTAGAEDALSAASAQPATAQTALTATTTAGPSRSQTPATRGRGARGASTPVKFMPKAVRRPQAERERIQQEELKKENDKAAQDAREKARANRSRGGRGRRARGGRGDMMNMRIIRGGSGTLGPFSEAPAYQPGIKQQSQSSYYGIGGGSSSSANRSFKMEASSRSQRDDHFTSYSRDRGRRVNADMLAPTVDLTDEPKEESSGITKKIVMPIGMLRLEHKDPEVVVATTAELEAAEQAGADDDSDIYVEGPDKDEEMGDDKQVWPGTSRPKRIKVEGEGGKLEEITEIDTLAERRAAKLPPSPEQKKKDVLREIPESKVAKRKQTVKDREDEETEEKQAMVRQFFGVQNEDEATRDTPHVDSAEVRKKMEGHMYLFQFPPVLPPLHGRPKDTQDEVKEEPNDDLVMLDAPHKDAGSTIDLTDDQTKVKQEEDATSAEGKSKNPSPEDLYGKGGFMGKLIVRKSGKLEFSWGGRNLEMEPGNEAQFLTTAVITEQFDQKPRPGEVSGKTYGMGQIYGKYVLAPTWDEEPEWVVDPSELP